MDAHTYQLLKFRVWRALPQALPYVFLAAVRRIKKRREAATPARK